LDLGEEKRLARARAVCERGDDLGEWVTGAIRIGAAAVAAAATGADLHRLQQALDQVSATVDQRVQDGMARLETAVAAAVDPHHGQLALVSQAAVTRLAQGVAALVTGPEATVPARVQVAVREVTDQALAEIARSLAAAQAAAQ
jgi:hypothetical protein